MYTTISLTWVTVVATICAMLPVAWGGSTRFCVWDSLRCPVWACSDWDGPVGFIQMTNVAATCLFCLDHLYGTLKTDVFVLFTEYVLPDVWVSESAYQYVSDLDWAVVNVIFTFIACHLEVAYLSLTTQTGCVVAYRLVSVLLHQVKIMPGNHYVFFS